MNMQTKIVTPQKMYNLKLAIPNSWLKAAGILKNKRKQLEKHVSKIRLEWGSRNKR